MRYLRGVRHRGRMSLDAPLGTERVVRRLAQMLQTRPADAPRVEPLAPSAPPARVVAVDGSSVVLAESGDRVLAAYRAGSVGVNRGSTIAPRVPAPTLALLSYDDASAAIEERLARAGVPGRAIGGIPPMGALDALRTIEELEAAREALSELRAGDLLLLDGPLQVRPLAPMLDELLARAAERGVDVVGVCKSTSLAFGATPALVACQIAARGIASTWLAPLPTPVNVRGRSFAARLSPAEARAFRFDLATAREPAALLASIAGLCGHPAYPGYPSPLAMAHNAVLLNDETRRRLRAVVQEAVLKAGVDADAWDAAFVDYHEVLELGA